MNLAHVVLPSTTVLYMHYRYGWDARAVGLLLAGVGVSSLIVQGFLVKPLVRFLKERRAVALGLAFGAAGFVIYGLAPTGTIFWIGVPVMALWGIATPSLQTIMTGLVSPTEQGRLQGALASLVGSRQPHRSHGVHSDLRHLHQHARRLGSAGRTLLAGGGARIHGHAAGLAHHPVARVPAATETA